MEPLYGFLNVAETIFKRSDRFLFRKTVFGDEIDLFRRHIFVFQDRDERRNVVFERDASSVDVVVRLPEGYCCKLLFISLFRDGFQVAEVDPVAVGGLAESFPRARIIFTLNVTEVRASK